MPSQHTSDVDPQRELLIVEAIRAPGVSVLSAHAPPQIRDRQMDDGERGHGSGGRVRRVRTLRLASRAVTHHGTGLLRRDRPAPRSERRGRPAGPRQRDHARHHGAHPWSAALRRCRDRSAARGGGRRNSARSAAPRRLTAHDGLGTVAAKVLFPEAGWAAAALVATSRPTDAALGLAVVMNPAVPARTRRALNVESGLNDGIATPFVTLFLSW